MDRQPEEIARGILRIANNSMINALNLASINRGHDPREFTLVAFGGGGGMHAAVLSAELGVKAVVIPRGASVFSAWGMMMSDLRRDYFVTRLIETNIAAGLDALCSEVACEASAQFATEGITEISTRALAKCRFQNQEHAVEVALAGGPVTEASLATLTADFHTAYEREYTYRLDAPVEIVGLHMVATAEIGKLAFEPQPVTGATLDVTRKGQRPVDFAQQGTPFGRHLRRHPAGTRHDLPRARHHRRPRHHHRHPSRPARGDRRLRQHPHHPGAAMSRHDSFTLDVIQ